MGLGSIGGSSSRATSGSISGGFAGGAGAGAGAGGAAAAIGASIIGTHMQNEANKEIAKRQMEFQRDMSNTSHQREVADLRRAGLNPILSANAGASTPQGASAHMESLTEGAVSTALDSLRLKKEISETDSRIMLNSIAGKAQSEAAQRDAATAKQINKQTEVLNEQFKAIKAKSRLEEKEALLQEKTLLPRYTNQLIQEGLGTVNSAMDIIKPKGLPKCLGEGKDGTKYHKQTGEVLRKP